MGQIKLQILRYYSYMFMCDISFGKGGDVGVEILGDGFLHPLELSAGGLKLGLRGLAG